MPVINPNYQENDYYKEKYNLDVMRINGLRFEEQGQEWIVLHSDLVAELYKVNHSMNGLLLDVVHSIDKEHPDEPEEKIMRRLLKLIPSRTNQQEN